MVACMSGFIEVNLRKSRSLVFCGPDLVHYLTTDSKGADNLHGVGEGVVKITGH
jgi:hypothetical protein